jgi:nucleoside-diphosphate-sugar epimerase
LTEDLVGPPYDADNMYGWAKLMGELTLRHLVKEGLLKAASCRYFTVYGPREKEDHAVIAMIARAFIQQNRLRYGEPVNKSAIGPTSMTSLRERS